MVLSELLRRRDRIRLLMAQQQIDAALIACNVNLLYTCGQVFSGYFYMPLKSPGISFVKRPNNITGERVYAIRKPEQIIDILKENGLQMPETLMLESDELSFSEHNRLSALFPDSKIVNGSPIIRQTRSVKTEIEIETIRRSAKAHANAYSKIPSVYKEGMTDLELSIEVERIMRLEGSLGMFRAFGRDMEIFMGSLLAGDNAAEPSPYDFALGGKGVDPSIPIGTSNAVIENGQSVMVDLGGNFYGYICDMSRVFSVGKLPEIAYNAHQVCLDVQNEIAEMAKPGVAAQDLYDRAIGVVTKAGFAENFMGITQKAKFIGHGIGLEINEPPVLAPRIKTELEPGMTFALEPKIILPGVGPVGIENTWLVNADGIEKLTICEEGIIDLLNPEA